MPSQESNGELILNTAIPLQSISNISKFIDVASLLTVLLGIEMYDNCSDKSDKRVFKLLHIVFKVQSTVIVAPSPVLSNVIMSSLTSQLFPIDLMILRIGGKPKLTLPPFTLTEPVGKISKRLLINKYNSRALDIPGPLSLPNSTDELEI